MREVLQLNQGTQGHWGAVQLLPDDPEATNQPPTEEMSHSEEGNNPRPGPSHFPDQGAKILWPTAIDQKFMDVAYNTRDESGKHKECMAYVCGYKDQEGTHATHLIFPAQEGSSSRVDDLGIQGLDTTLYMAQTVAPSVNEPGREYKLISWMHTHVQGTPAGFSSIDLHNQNALDSYVSPGVIGTVYELTENRYMYRREPYILTNEGSARVKECEHTHGVTNEQHSQCFHLRFYMSIRDKLCLTDDDITVIDGRKSMPLAGDPSAQFADPFFETVPSYQCRACKEKFANDSALLMHVGRKKTCKPSYESEIEHFRDFVRKRRYNNARETYVDKHYDRVINSDAKAYQKRKAAPAPQENGNVCPICESTFKWKKSLKRHMKEVHSSSKEFECPSCAKPFSRQETLDRHVRDVHKNSVDDKIDCGGTDCEAKFSRLENWKEHWLSAHADKHNHYYCVECEEVFTQSQHLTRHFNEIHLGEQYICQQCPATFSRRDQFDKHNEGDKHWQYHFCWECNKVLQFKKKEDVGYHFSDHEYEKQGFMRRGVGCMHAPEVKDCGCCKKWYNMYRGDFSWK